MLFSAIRFICMTQTGDSEVVLGLIGRAFYWGFESKIQSIFFLLRTFWFSVFGMSKNRQL